MQNVLLFDAPLKERIWGSNYFKDTLKITDNPLIGEMWSLSALPGDESRVINGKYKGLTLKELYENHSELFGNEHLNEFPILIKLIATKDKLSVQVHPDDIYGKRVENSLGKTEGWLFLDKEPSSTIVVGINAKDKNELTEMVNNKEYDKLLRTVSPEIGSFYPIPAGTVHALGENLLLLEVQQSSNVTYRFYDYDRKDKNGNLRELHVKKALDVTSTEPYNEEIKNVLKEESSMIWDNQYFHVSSVSIHDELKIKADDKYIIASVIEGNLEIDSNKLLFGSSFIIPSNEEITIKGNGKLVLTLNKVKEN